MPAASDIHGSFVVFRNMNCQKQRSRQKLDGANPNQNTALVSRHDCKNATRFYNIHGSFVVFRNMNCQKRRSCQKLDGANPNQNTALVQDTTVKMPAASTTFTGVLSSFVT